MSSSTGVARLCVRLDHQRVKHTVNEYVLGDVHSNTVESVWSLFKRSVVGSYRQLSVKHFPAYLVETEWRFNNRRNEYLFRNTIVALMKSEVLGYEKLVAKDEPRTDVESAKVPF